MSPEEVAPTPCLARGELGRESRNSTTHDLMGNLHKQRRGENTAVLRPSPVSEEDGEDLSYWKNKLGDTLSNIMGIKSGEVIHGLSHLMEKVSSLL